MGPILILSGYVFLWYHQWVFSDRVLSHNRVNIIDGAGFLFDCDRGEDNIEVSGRGVALVDNQANYGPFCHWFERFRTAE